MNLQAERTHAADAESGLSNTHSNSPAARPPKPSNAAGQCEPMTAEFEALLRWGGSPQATCGCGRVHFTDSGDFMEPGELDRLRAKAKAEPDRYIADGDNDSVSSATLAGVTAVWGCRCRYFERLESFLWSNREVFLRYYRSRIHREKSEANAIEAQLP